MCVPVRSHRGEHLPLAQRKKGRFARFLSRRTDLRKSDRIEPRSVPQSLDADPTPRTLAHLWTTGPPPFSEFLERASLSRRENSRSSKGSVCVPACVTDVNANRLYALYMPPPSSCPFSAGRTGRERPLEALPTAKQVELKKGDHTAAPPVEEGRELPSLLLFPYLRAGAGFPAW